MCGDMALPTRTLMMENQNKTISAAQFSQTRATFVIRFSYVHALIATGRGSSVNWV